MESWVKLYLSEKSAEIDIKVMYKFELDKDRLQIYVKSLDAGVKLLAAQLSQGNSLLNLRQALPDLIKINNEAMFLDQAIDEVDKASKPNGANKPIELMDSPNANS